MISIKQSFRPGILILLWLFIILSCQVSSPPENKPEEAREPLSVEMNYLSSRQGEFILSWPPLEDDSLEPFQYAFYYSQKDNLQTVEDLLNNGTEIPLFDPYTDPAVLSYIPLEAQGRRTVKLKPIEASTPLYINIIAQKNPSERFLYQSSRVAYDPEDFSQYVHSSLEISPLRYLGNNKGELTLSFPPLEEKYGISDPVYKLYYSHEDNINNLENIDQNGLPLLDAPASGMHYKNPLEEESNIQMDISSIELDQNLQLSVVVEEKLNPERRLSYPSSGIFASLENLRVLEAQDSFQYIVPAQEKRDMDRSYFTDVKGDPTNIYLGLYNHNLFSLSHYNQTKTAMEAQEPPSYQFSYHFEEDTPGPGPLFGEEEGKALEYMEALGRQNQELAQNLQWASSSGPSASTVSAPLPQEALGDNFDFYIGTDPYHSTLRYIGEPVSVSTPEGRENKTIKIWVEDTSWHAGGTEPNLVTPEMLEVLGEKFLVQGENNDIYDGVTSLYGEEWGPHQREGLLGEPNVIHILLADLGRDNSTTGGILGMFSGKDLYDTDWLNEAQTIKSNRKVMFYLDSVIFSNTDEAGGDWVPDGAGPSHIISALTHEFVHLLDFYQGYTLRDLSSRGIWASEMLAMATEDLLSEKIGIPGPRGYKSTDGRSYQGLGAANGRPLLFNAFTGTLWFTWLNGYQRFQGRYISKVLLSYSLHYVYGAYLVRNFGGPALLRKLMYELDGSQDKIESILTEIDPINGKFNVHIPKMYLGMLLSKKPELRESLTEELLLFNNDGWFSWDLDGITYRAGSLNFYDYGISPTFHAPPGGSGVTIPPRTFYLSRYSGQTGVSRFDTTISRHDFGILMAMIR